LNFLLHLGPVLPLAPPSSFLPVPFSGGDREEGLQELSPEEEEEEDDESERSFRSSPVEMSMEIREVIVPAWVASSGREVKER
jgi:hypothetical protein